MPFSSRCSTISRIQFEGSTFQANLSRRWARPGTGAYRAPALNTIESPVVGPPSSLAMTLIPLTSETANGAAGDDVFVAVAAAYVRRQTSPRAIAAAEGDPARKARCCREAATALGTGCLMSILPNEGTAQSIDERERERGSRRCGQAGADDRLGLGLLSVVSGMQIADCRFFFSDSDFTKKQ